MRQNLLSPCVILLAAAFACAQPKEIELKSTPIANTERPAAALRTDSMGRLFAAAGQDVIVLEAKKPATVLVRFPGGTKIRDLEFRGDDLYVLTHNALYQIPGGVRQRKDLAARKLIWGVPVAADGAGFQSLAWGPEGDLYFTLGIGGLADKGRQAYWTFFTQPDDTKVPYRGVGGVFRCKPDGSDLRIIAHGLRRPGQLALDRHWNLFVIAGSRVEHVTPHLRCGPDVPPVLDDVAGSVLWYLEEPALPKELHRHFLARARDRLSSYVFLRKGAGFVSVKQAPVALDPGALAFAGGRVFGLDAQGIVDVTDPGVRAPAEFAAYEATEAPAARLWRELSEPSWQRRYRAHLEIVRRGGDLLKEANQRLLDTRPGDPALHPLLWLAARSGQGHVQLLGRTHDADADVRAQAVRALTEFPEQLRGEPIFSKMLLDPELHVQHAAVLAYLSPKVAWGDAAQFALERGPARDADPFLRQAAALVLAQKATLRQLETMCGRVDPVWRRAGVRAAGYRLTLPPSGPLAPHLPLEALPFSTRMVYLDGVVDLAGRGRLGTFTVAQHWKADKQTVEQNLLARLLRKMRDDEDAAVRAEAARFLPQ